MQAGDDGMKQVEDEAMMGEKGMAGMDTSREAMHEVLGHERDLILARSHSHTLPCPLSCPMIMRLQQSTHPLARLTVDRHGSQLGSHA